MGSDETPSLRDGTELFDLVDLYSFQESDDIQAHLFELENREGSLTREIGEIRDHPDFPTDALRRALSEMQELLAAILLQREAIAQEQLVRAENFSRLLYPEGRGGRGSRSAPRPPRPPRSPR